MVKVNVSAPKKVYSKEELTAVIDYFSDPVNRVKDRAVFNLICKRIRAQAPKHRIEVPVWA